MSVLNILAFFTAAGAAWQDLHFRKVSNRYLAICLGLTILLYILMGIKAFTFSQSFDYVMLANRKANPVTNSVSDDALNIRSNMASDDALNIRSNMASDSALHTIADMAVDMAIYIGGGMAVPVLFLWWAFLLRKIGAGDIKLLAVLGAMMGPERILNCMLWTCMITLAMEGMKWSIHHFEYSLWRNEKNPEEKLKIQCLDKVRKRGIPLALPVFLATLSGICGMY